MNWFAVALVLAVGTAAVAAACAAVCWMAFDDTIRDIEPRWRFWLLGGLAASPPAAGMMVLLVAFYPSVLDVIGLVADHCGTHSGHSLHLCFVHQSPPSVSAPILWLCIGLVAVGSRNWIREIATTVSSLQWADRLVKLAHFDGDRGIYVAESDRLFAVTAGLVRRRIVISDRLQQCLSPKQLGAVVAHEQAHRRRFDGMTMFILRLAAGCHLPGVGRRVVEELRLASEQCCDQAAGGEDHLTVAETILAVERHRQQTAVVPCIERFCTPNVEQRIQGLLREDWYRPNRIVIAAGAVAVTGMVVSNLHTLHHLTEHVFAWFV